jgi:hypothetical protein
MQRDDCHEDAFENAADVPILGRFLDHHGSDGLIGTARAFLRGRREKSFDSFEPWPPTFPYAQRWRAPGQATVGPGMIDLAFAGAIASLGEHN